MFCLCVFTTITNDKNKAREEKNSQTNFDTLNTQKEKLDDAKNFLRQKRRERRIGGLSHLLLLSSQNMTATMDVDSDDDDEIIAERGTIACILIFSRRARVCTSFSLITFDDQRKERRRSLRAKTTDNNTFGRNEIRTLSSELEGTLRITR